MSFVTVQRGDAPLIVSLPHTGTELPADLVPRLVSRGSRAEGHGLARSTTLYGFARGLGATTVRTAMSRTAIDVNRDPSGASLYPGQATTGLTPVETFDGEPLYRDGEAPGAGEVAARRQRWFEPYPRRARAPRSPGAAALHSGASSSMTAIRSARSCRGCFPAQLPVFNIGTNGGTSCDPGLREAVTPRLPGERREPRGRRPLQGRLDHPTLWRARRRASMRSRWSSRSASTSTRTRPRVPERGEGGAGGGDPAPAFSARPLLGRGHDVPSRLRRLPDPPSLERARRPRRADRRRRDGRNVIADLAQAGCGRLLFPRLGRAEAARGRDRQHLRRADGRRPFRRRRSTSRRARGRSRRRRPARRSIARTAHAPSSRRASRMARRRASPGCRRRRSSSTARASHRRLEVDMAASSSLLLVEAVLLGRRASGERLQRGALPRLLADPARRAASSSPRSCASTAISPAPSRSAATLAGGSRLRDRAPRPRPTAHRAMEPARGAAHEIAAIEARNQLI